MKISTFVHGFFIFWSPKDGLLQCHFCWRRVTHWLREGPSLEVNGWPSRTACRGVGRRNLGTPKGMSCHVMSCHVMLFQGCSCAKPAFPGLSDQEWGFDHQWYLRRYLDKFIGSPSQLAGQIPNVHVPATQLGLPECNWSEAAGNNLQIGNEGAATWEERVKGSWFACCKANASPRGPRVWNLDPRSMSHPKRTWAGLRNGSPDPWSVDVTVKGL